MSAFRVDRDELIDAVDRLQRFEQRMQGALEDADREVNRLHATWSGTAAEGHREVHARWRRGCEDMHAALTTMRSAAIAAHDNYSAAATANASMWAM